MKSPLFNCLFHYFGGFEIELVILWLLLYKYQLPVGLSQFSNISLVTHESSEILDNNSDIASVKSLNTITELITFNLLFGCINLRYYPTVISIAGYHIGAPL